MIGFIVLILAVMGFMGIGYTLLTASFLIFMNTVIITSLAGLVGVALFGLLWEFYFQEPAKTIIANRRAASWEWLTDDVGYARLTPSKRYMPQGLIEWIFGWSLLPRPVMKLDIVGRLTGRKRGRPRKDPEEERKAREQFEALEKQLQNARVGEQTLAEQIGLKKCTWRGIGKPVWFQYLGLAANFNPYVLVPSEMKQDNPRSYFQQARDHVNGLSSLTVQSKLDLVKTIDGLEQHVDKVRLVIDPRRFKEIHPKMYTQSQIDDHGRIHEEIGRNSVTGLPMKTIVTVLLIVVVAVVGLGAFYFLFMKPQEAPKQAASLLRLLVGKG